MFLKIETENCQNQEAASLYQNDKSEFKSKVKECVEFRYFYSENAEIQRLQEKD